ncbi:TALPID3 protein-like [Asterias rubens]|uniref:TALPID3 protein-like n=1 Tax=Asterias rubens TaxID=7604 RepID=UPI00145516A2|nr:TALPID3 protein-like [Asterias rubens]
MQRRLEPAPLDVYLRKWPSVPVTLPASSHLKPPLSPSQYNAPVPSSMCAEARAVLDQVQSSRACLQANLEAVIRAKEQEEFYNYLDSLHLEGEAAEKAQLRYKVGRMIAAIDEEIKHEVPIKPRKAESSIQGIGNNKLEKPSNLASRPVKTGTKKKPVSSKIDSGLRNQTTSKGEDKNMVKGRHNKENFAQPKKLPISQAKRQPTVDHNRDEAYLTRVYGKALYQMRRSTMKKEPYLKYTTSSPQSKPARSLSAAQVKGTEMKSAKTQTTPKSGAIPVPNPNSQFFFDPYPTLQATMQQEQPSHQPAPVTAPSHGQLIPMAVPLGPPQRGGLTQPVTIKTDGLERGVVKDLERRDVQSNVAVVNVKSKKKPQLTVQHLPAVDIDTEPPSSASSIIEHHQSPERVGRTEISEPDDSRLPGQSSPSQFSHYLAVADEDVEPQNESEDELPAPGISLPGHYSETRRPYHGPPFPPQAPPSIPSRAGPSSEQLAADMRKDLIENKALEWIEQELMARMISELYSKQPAVQPRPESPDSSLASSSNDSIVDTIGPAGLQLFVDAGQAVDHALVSALVREVLEEKVTTVLGQHDRDIPRQQTSPTPQATASPVIPRSPIPTPEVTPLPSPVHTPPRAASLVATPLASPSHSSPAESETENLEELARTMDATASDEPIPAPSARVATPINTPPPSPPPDIATPPLSPRESPKLISVIDGSIITPVPTPQPVSPEPEMEESLQLPPTPEPVVIEEEPIPPTPTPSLLTPSTPTPSLSTATTTQPSPCTETAGRSISEGEWLISGKSEGQIDSTEDEPGAIGLPELSSGTSIDSTLMGAEELEPDLQDDELSEGEISPVKRTPRLLTRDPVVAILAHMSQRPDPSAAPPYFTSSQTLNNNGTKSLGEVSVGQCPILTPSSERMLFKEAYGTKPPEVTPRSEVRSVVRREVSGGEQRDTARQQVDDFTLRVSHLERTDVEDETDELGAAATVQPIKQAKPHPAPRIIQVAGRPSPSPEPDEDDERPYPSEERYENSRRRGEMDVEHHGGDEDDNVGGFHGRRGLPPRASIPSNLFGTQTMSDLGTRTLTPDALNLEALLQSGYLSQTFSQSEGGTSDFESQRPMGQTLGSTGPTFHEPTYDDSQNITEGSLELPESRDPGARIPGMMSFSVTLPSAVESQGIDLSQTISEGELPVPDTTSDVSELSGGDL